MWTATCATLALCAVGWTPAIAADPPALTAASATSTAGAAQLRDPAAQGVLAPDAKLRLLRERIKYVFVIFQENRSFDHYFGTYPGADGLFSRPAAETPGFTQAIRDTDGTYATISPFLIPRTVLDKNGNTVPIYPEDTASVDHSHVGMVNSAHFAADKKTARNDAYALDEERLGYDATGAIVATATGAAPTANPSLAQKQMAELTMGHQDCDTIPFLWQYADRFTLFDNFHQTTIGPSTPNAIAMIAGQTGETQWALHPEQGASGTVPVVGDSGPFPGSNKDAAAGKPPYGPEVNPAKPTGNLTFASLPLSFMGQRIEQIIAQDQNPAADLLDVQDDIREIASRDPAVRWGWYQQGYDREPFDGTTTPDGVAHTAQASYIVHHNGPQYFGYLGDNKAARQNLHGLADFYADVADSKLPPEGGVFYVRGGFYNNDGLVTLDANPVVRQTFPGNDDHPAYSDAQISEASVADTINAIAGSPYWEASAIIITYDETDGMYDHAPQHVRAWDPKGYPLTGGPRITAIVVSPFSAAHTVSHMYSEHSSVIRFVDELLGLVPLADLPDERRARALGKSELGQADLGPADDLVAPMGDLSEAFDNDRLLGHAPSLPARYATIDRSIITALPHYNGAGCKALGITPTDYDASGRLLDPPPADFNPRPATNPGIPTSGAWTP
jgi:phospholipase C